MPSLRSLVVLAIVGAVGFSAQVSEAALAQAAGGSGFSGTLSKNKAIRKQQLIADPAEPVYGSISIAYDPNVVTISGLIFGPGYTGNAMVEVSNDGLFLQDFDSFLSAPAGNETGYVQVFFNEPTIITAAAAPFAAPVHGQITPPAGYTTIDSDGPAAVDTHAFFFDYLSTVPDSAIARYTIYADAGTRSSENNPDFLYDGQNTISHGDIASASVSGSLNSVPVPPAVWMGGLMLASLAYNQLRRRIA